MRSFARASFGLTALGMNFFCCVNFFCFRMASPCGHCIATQLLHYALSSLSSVGVDTIGAIGVASPYPYSCCDLVEMIGPTLERGPHVVGVLGAIINASHSRLVSRLVVEDGLDNVGVYAKLGHASGGGAT